MELKQLQIWINTRRPAAYTKIKLSYFIVGWKMNVHALSNIWFLLDDKSSLFESSFGRGSRWASNLYNAGCLVMRHSFKSLILPSFRIYLLSYLYSLLCPLELNVASLTYLRVQEEEQCWSHGPCYSIFKPLITWRYTALLPSFMSQLQILLPVPWCILS